MGSRHLSLRLRYGPEEKAKPPPLAQESARLPRAGYDWIVLEAKAGFPALTAHHVRRAGSPTSFATRVAQFLLIT